MELICENCGEEFILEDAVYWIEEDPDGMVITYVKCPHCSFINTILNDNGEWDYE